MKLLTEGKYVKTAGVVCEGAGIHRRDSIE